MEYTLSQIIKHRLNFGNAIVHLQADLDLVRQPADVSPLYVREMNPSDIADLTVWAELKLINGAYQESPSWDVNTAKKHIENHLFLNISKTYFLIDGNIPVAAISIGVYRTNPQIGGQARIAVRGDIQGKGLGKFIISYGCQQLKAQGLQLCENIVSIKRERSIRTHFRCGFFLNIRAGAGNR